MSTNCKADFPLLAQRDIAYLDSAATAQRPQCVLDAEQEFYTQYRQPVHVFRLPIVRIILIIFLVRLVLSLLFGGFTRYSYSGYGDYGYYNGGSEAPYTQEYTQRTPNPAEEWT